MTAARWNWKHPSIVGTAFTEWTIIEPGTGSNKIRCRCSCGIEREVYVSNLQREYSKCCGNYVKHPELRPKPHNRGNESWRSLGVKER